MSARVRMVHGLVVTSFFFVAWFVAFFMPCYLWVRAGESPAPELYSKATSTAPAAVEVARPVGSIAQGVLASPSFWVVAALSTIAGVLLLRGTELSVSLPTSFAVAAGGLLFGFMLELSAFAPVPVLGVFPIPLAVGLGLMLWAMLGFRAARQRQLEHQVASSGCEGAHALR